MSKGVAPFRVTCSRSLFVTPRTIFAVSSDGIASFSAWRAHTRRIFGPSFYSYTLEGSACLLYLTNCFNAIAQLWAHTKYQNCVQLWTNQLISPIQTMQSILFSRLAQSSFFFWWQPPPSVVYPNNSEAPGPDWTDRIRATAHRVSSEWVPIPKRFDGITGYSTSNITDSEDPQANLAMSPQETITKHNPRGSASLYRKLCWCSSFAAVLPQTLELNHTTTATYRADSGLVNVRDVSAETRDEEGETSEWTVGRTQMYLKREPRADRHLPIDTTRQ